MVVHLSAWKKILFAKSPVALMELGELVEG
jgi:hypothetical protein